MRNLTTPKWLLTIVSLVLLLAVVPWLTACDDDDDETTTSLVEATTTKPTTTTTTTAEATTTEPTGVLLTIDSKMGDLLDNPDTKAILEKHLPPDIMAKAGLVRSFALPELAPMSEDVTDEMLEAIASDLEALGAYATTTATTTAPTETTTEISGEPVKIGVLVAWSGSMGIAGLLVDQVLDVADYYLEERGGILGERPVEWEKQDTAGDIAKAQSGAQKLASDDNVLAITLGGVTAGELTSGVILSSELRIPFFTMSTWPEMKDYPYAVRSGTVMNWYRAELCVEYTLTNLAPDTVGFLGVSSDDAHSALEHAKGIFEDAGVETVYEQYVPYDTTDLTPQLSRIKAENPDVLFLFLDNSGSMISMFKQVTSLGGWGDIDVMSIASTTGDAVGETGAQGTYYWAYWLPGLPYDAAKKFEEAWQTVHGDAPNSIHPALFTTIWAAVEAIDQAGVGADRQDIADFIRSGKFGFESPGGPLVIDANGDPNIRGVIALVKDGKPVVAP